MKEKLKTKFLLTPTSVFKWAHTQICSESCNKEINNEVNRKKNVLSADYSLPLPYVPWVSIRNKVFSKYTFHCTLAS